MADLSMGNRNYDKPAIIGVMAAGGKGMRFILIFSFCIEISKKSVLFPKKSHFKRPLTLCTIAKKNTERPKEAFK